MNTIERILLAKLLHTAYHAGWRCTKVSDGEDDYPVKLPPIPAGADKTVIAAAACTVVLGILHGGAEDIALFFALDGAPKELPRAQRCGMVNLLMGNGNHGLDLFYDGWPANSDSPWVITVGTPFTEWLDRFEPAEVLNEPANYRKLLEMAQVTVTPSAAYER